MGSRGRSDERSTFDTPTPVEVWRTALYLHDGRCATIEQLLTEGRHGGADQLRAEEVADLAASVLSL